MDVASVFYIMSETSALKLTVCPMNDTPKPSVTIKKYANRRLYNTATSSYVTLETLAGMVKEGVEFNVYDAKTGEDITRSVLTQIIVEEEGKTDQQNLLPVSFLRQLIGFYGNNMQWLVPKYLEHSMQTLSNNQDQITNYFQTTFGNMFPFGSAFEEMSKQNMALFERTMRLFAPFVAPTQGELSVKTSVHDTVSRQEPADACSVAAVATPPQEALKTVEDIVRPVVEAVDVPSVRLESAPVESVVVPPVSVSPVTEPPAPAVEPAAKPMPDYSSSSSPPPAAAPESVSTPKSAPSPLVHSSPAAVPTADDMQEKIANLQRQLADLAKNRA